jgi:SAM-dependent methyltransferase
MQISNVQIDDILQRGQRKIHLTHLVYGLLLRGMIPPVDGIKALNIGPSSTGIDGLVMRQFGVTDIDAIEKNEVSVKYLRGHVKDLATHHTQYNPPLYADIEQGDISDPLSVFEGHRYDLIFAFNMHAGTMDWEKVPSALTKFLRKDGSVLFTAPERDAEVIQFEEPVREIGRFDISPFLASLAIERIPSWNHYALGREEIYHDQFGFQLPPGFSYDNHKDTKVIIARKG